LKLDISDAARADIRAAHAFSVTHWGKPRADEYILEIRARMKLLASGSLTGVAAEHVGPGLRRQNAGSHAIWFRIEGDRLRVVRVLHQSREAGIWVG
jgi:toxin ParE1/3/4